MGSNIVKTTSKFIEELKEIQPDLVVVAEYISSRSKIEVMTKYGECFIKLKK